jgi:drug/metabolite transporter (DMT)-like permease
MENGMKPVFVILLIGMNLLWAGSYPIYKVLSHYLNTGSIATLRYGFAALMMVAAWRWLPGKTPRGRDLVRVAIMGVLVFCVAPRLQIEGVHRGQAGDTSLLLALDPLVTALAAAIFLGEHILLRRWVGFLLGMLGVVLLSRVWQPGVQPLKGLLAYLIFISSFFAEAAYSVMGKPLLPRLPIFKMLVVSLLAGTVANLFLDGLTGANTFQAMHQLPLSGWLLLIYMAVVCTIVGYSLWYLVIRETEVNITGLTVFVQPLAGLALSVACLGESLHIGQFWGSVVIVLGLVVGLRRNGRAITPEKPLPSINLAVLGAKRGLRFFR